MANTFSNFPNIISFSLLKFGSETVDFELS